MLGLCIIFNIDFAIYSNSDVTALSPVGYYGFASFCSAIAMESCQ